MAVGDRSLLVAGSSYYAISVHFASGQSVSDSVDLFLLEVDAIRLPAAWTPAALAFDESPDVDPAGAPSYGWLPAYDDGGGDVPAEFRLRVVAGTSMRLNGLLDPYRWVRFRSVAVVSDPTATAAPVAQAAARTLVILARSL
jgi:hypothetical protein